MSAAETHVEFALTGGSVVAAAVDPVGSTLDSLAGESAKAAAERDGLRQPQPALLIDIAPDLLTLHTRDAYRLFAGRGWDEEGGQHRIIGGQRAASVLNALRHISVGGNPYADWFLVCFDDQLTALRTRLVELVAECEEEFVALKKKGLALNVLGSRQPLELTVAFGSSYGYAIAETMLEFDYYVRVVKTLVLKNRIRLDAGREAIRGIGRSLRRLFVRVIRWERVLRSPELRDITREDFLPTANEAARLRVRAAVARVGWIPRGVLDGTTLPPHVRRRSEAGDESFVVQPRPTQSPAVAPGDQTLL